ncbi:MAG TPA: bZIP transcription factor, partial [Bacteroidia bacterium]|nr:bZIP transcription factor [Bacteroidia bacterium]
ASPWTTNGTTIYYGTGKVLIGNPNLSGFKGTPGSYQLYVQGGILTEKIKAAVATTNDWSDYVFAEDYNLKSLKEVEQFIKRNNHLPNVPSAQDVVNEGIDMVKMDAKLLEKIEELTLYLIELDKRNAEQEKQIKELRSKLKTIKN